MIYIYYTYVEFYLLLLDVFHKNDIVVNCVFSLMWKVKFYFLSPFYW